MLIPGNHRLLVRRHDYIHQTIDPQQPSYLYSWLVFLGFYIPPILIRTRNELYGSREQSKRLSDARVAHPAKWLPRRLYDSSELVPRVTSRARQQCGLKKSQQEDQLACFGEHCTVAMLGSAACLSADLAHHDCRHHNSGRPK